jgi:hypothetical protein
VNQPFRDPATGAVPYPLTVNIRVRGEMLPRVYRLEDWGSLAGFITSPDFPAGTESLIAERTDAP